MFHRYREKDEPKQPAAPRPRCPRGLTLLELLIATSIMVIVMGTLAALSKAVQVSTEYSEGHGTATQHARVCLERITRVANEATANESFPGFLVVAEEVGAWRFPDTLVVWHPDGSPVDPEGLPRYNELVIYCPDPVIPDQLLEITVPSDTRQVPPAGDASAWASAVDWIKRSPSSQKTPLTSLLRTGLVPEASTTMERGAVRFESRLRPSADDWSSYQGGSLSWNALNWVQGIYGSQTGVRQAWLRIELQLIPDQTSGGIDASGQQALPFFGSAAVYYEMHR